MVESAGSWTADHHLTAIRSAQPFLSESPPAANPAFAVFFAYLRSRVE
jgi:hypothetical protein